MAMTEENFKTEMLKKGWNEGEIQEFIDDYNEGMKNSDLISLPLEHWLQDKPKMRRYYVNNDGNIVDEEI